MTPSAPASILVIEDREDDVRFLREALKEARVVADLRVVADGARALEVLRDEGAAEPDLILLDIHTPKKSGFAVLSEMKNDRRLAQIPVIVTTGSDVDEKVLKLYDLRVDSILKKPIQPDQFLRAVKAVPRLQAKLLPPT